MKPKLTVFFIVALIMVLYDAMASGASRFLQLDYTYFAFGSMLLYFLAGFVACWREGILMGVLAGLVAGLAESTFGWAISTLIGPKTDVSVPDLTPVFIVFAVIFVIIEASVIGLIGSGTASLLKRLTPQQVR